jgi:hypothetical protein
MSASAGPSQRAFELSALVVRLARRFVPPMGKAKSTRRHVQLNDSTGQGQHAVLFVRRHRVG